MILTMIGFHMSSQPDFEALKRRGWKHPQGLRDELLENSLVKKVGGCRLQIVRHRARDWDYSEVFVDSDPDEMAIRRKGAGPGMTVETAKFLIDSLYRDMEENDF